MALSRNGERIMNIKRLAALLTLGALLSTAAPALAVAPIGTVNVEWNYAITATLVLVTQDSTATGNGYTMVAPAANDIYWASDPAGSAVSQCNGSQSPSKDGATNGPWAASKVNFGNVVSDGTDYTDCTEINAVDAYVVTNDSLGAKLSVYISAGTPANYGAANGSLLCIYQANTWNTAGNTAFAASGRSAAIPNNSMTSCAPAPSGVATAYMVGTAAPPAATNLLSLTAPTTGSDINQDMDLVLAPLTASGLQNATLTYTFTTN
jgi:hypothetical protein